MSFHWPYVLLALPAALAALLALFARSYHARQRLLGQFAAQRLLPALLTSYSPGLRRAKHLLVVAGVLLVVTALARPQWGYDWQEQRAKGLDVIFVLDTSKSMLTQDIPPSRLERAKLAIIDLVEKTSGNRVGLVAFAGQAFLQCPLTLDYDAFRQSLEAVDTTTITQGGTNIAAGLNEAAAALENSGNHKVIVLLSDGEDLQGDGIAAAKALRDQGVTIYTVGVGTPQGDIIPIAGKDGQVDFVRDDHGEIVKSHLDAATLTAIAQASNNGFYEPLGATGEGLVQVYESGIKTIPEQQLTSRLQRQALERFQWPLALALLFLALDPLIGTRRPSWVRRSELRDNPAVLSSATTPAGKSAVKAATAVVVALLAGIAWLLSAPHAHAQSAPAPAFVGSPGAAPASTSPTMSANDTSAPAQSLGPAPVGGSPATPLPAPPAASPKVAEQLYQQGDYKAAAAAYGDAATANPQDGRFRYDQGASLYRSGDYDAAAQAFQQTLSANNLNLQQQAYYGLGNTRYRLGQQEIKQDPKKTVSTWEDAAKAYQNALELNPKDSDAHYNLNLLNQELAELKKQLDQQQKQQQQQNQQNQNQQNQQNQNQQDQQNQQNQSQSQQQQNSSQNQQQQQQQNNSQQNQQSQQGQQNQQQPQNGGQQSSSQNQSGSQQQPQNQNPQQNQSSSNQNQQSQNQKNGQDQQKQNQSGQNPQNQNQPGQQKQNQGQQPSPGQQGQQKQNQGPGQQPQPQPGQNGQQLQPGQQPKPGQNGSPPQQPSSQSPGANKQPQAGPQPGSPQANPQNNPQGTQPTGARPGQNPANSGAAGAAAAGSNSAQDGNSTVAVPGAMTREEARQVLDSLKNSERKLPVTNYDAQKEGVQDTSSPGFKDW